MLFSHSIPSHDSAESKGNGTATCCPDMVAAYVTIRGLGGHIAFRVLY